MSKRISLVGQTFTRMDVISDGPSDKWGKAQSWCKCRCGNSELYLVSNGNLVQGNVKSCGCLRQLANISRGFTHEMFVQRFWNSYREVQRDYVTPCWEWLKSKCSGGYGTVRYKHRTRSAHIVAWELTHGPSLDDLEVCHHCDWPPCINPSHLFKGTHRQNMQDSIVKERFVFPPPHPGELCGRSKLTEMQILEIRRCYDTGLENQYQLAERFGVEQSNIHAIVRRKSWKHI